MKINALQICRLPDGRGLAYASYGDPQGFPVFFFHGTPGSHIDLELFEIEDTATRLGVRLIAVDRPGIGLSDYQPGRRFLDWPDDLSALADELALERFSVLGYSSGGAYALVCAFKIPERLARVGVLNGDGPYDQPGIVEGMELLMFRLLSLSSSAPGLFRQILRLVGWTAVHAPGLYQAGFQVTLPRADQAIFARLSVRQALRATLQEALLKGPQGAQQDMALMVEQWDFRPEDISTPVCMWYGQVDQSTSPAMGRYLAKVIRGSTIQFFPEDGHLSLLYHHSQQILKALIP
jgi:pimeloyl-ACP methyl ester carboxylesterase